MTLHTNLSLSSRALAAAAALSLALALAGVIAPSSQADDAHSLTVVVQLPGTVDHGWMHGVYLKLTGTSTVTVQPDTDTGTFTFTALAPGHYSLDVWAGAYADGAATVHPSLLTVAMQDIDIADTDFEFDVTMQEGGVVTGHVTLPAGWSNGTYAGVNVVANSQDGYTSPPVTPDADGNYAIYGVLPGSNDIVFSAMPMNVGGFPVTPNFATQYFPNQATDPLFNVWVEPVSTGVTSDIYAHLEQRVLTGPTPTVSGVKGLADTLMVSAGTWSPKPSTLSYRWYRNGVAISGAYHSTYKLTSSDSTKTITVKVTGASAGFDAVAKTSTAIVMPKFFAKAPTPTITGTYKYGHTLTLHRGTWSPTPAYSYRWYRNGVAISGAYHSTYKLTSSDRGKKITVTVTAKKSGYGTDSKTSASKTIAK